MQKQLANPGRIVIVDISEIVRTDVSIEENGLASQDAGMAVFEIRLSVPQRLHLAPYQHQTGFVDLVDEVVVSGLTVDAYQFFFLIFMGRHGLP